jgi:hypothetical protein
VGRATLYRWLDDDPAFIAAYNQARRELAEAVRQQLQSLAGEAVGVLRTILTGPEVPMGLRLKAALEVLRAATEAEVGPTDAGEAAVALRERDTQRRRDEMLANIHGAHTR